MSARALKAAFPLTLPVMAGYLFLGLGFGVLLHQAGYGAPWALLMSAGIYAGAMQYAAIGLLVSGAGLAQAALLTLLVNARHLFYGLSMARRYAGAGRWKPYLAFALTDETYALLSLTKVPPDIPEARFYAAVSLLNQLYWVAGSLLGALLGQWLPLDLRGIEFSMPALFVVMLVEQSRVKAARASALLGLALSLLCLLALGPGGFTLPALLGITGLLLLKPRLGTRESAP
ncbi:MAG: branched-chain amino acid transporter AzlC [Clostridiales bacterium]|nr:branched-chain amino acid transporter AzlC [Clostridiales bacterium]